jgi:hypothetical protein
MITAAATGEVVTKGLADGEFLDEQYEDERLKMIGDISLTPVADSRAGGRGGGST